MSKLRAKEHSKSLYINYLYGFVVSLILTLAAYVLTTRVGSPTNIILFFLATLAVIQVVIQLTFFLHLDSEPKPRWNIQVFIFTAMVVVIIVFGSLWIMKNLDYNMSTYKHTDSYIIKDEGVQPSQR